MSLPLVLDIFYEISYESLILQLWNPFQYPSPGEGNSFSITTSWQRLHPSLRDWDTRTLLEEEKMGPTTSSIFPHSSSRGGTNLPRILDLIFSSIKVGKVNIKLFLPGCSKCIKYRRIKNPLLPKGQVKCSTSIVPMLVGGPHITKLVGFTLSLVKLPTTPDKATLSLSNLPPNPSLFQGPYH